MLSAEGRERVEAAIREAERTTSGEIVVIVARRASRYRSVPMLAALVLALLVPWPLIAWTQIGIGTILLLQIGIAAAVFAAASPLPVRLALAPGLVKRGRAREAAEREFASHGMADTRGRTGVLLYLAEAERHAEVICDVAIAGRVDDAEWRAIIDDLVGALQQGEAAPGLAGAVAAIGAILARVAPPEAGDTDELPNRVVLL